MSERNPDYRRLQKRGSRIQLKKIFNMFVGFIIILIGVALWFLPGPGWATIFIGAALIAGESLQAARFLDFLEVKMRKILKKEK